MNAIEFWILDCAIDGHIKISWLETSGRESWEDQKRPREVNNEQVVTALDELYQRGDLYACTTVDGKMFGELVTIPIPTRIEIARSIVNPEYVLGYGLTAQGGSRWEEITQPQWDLLLNTSEGRDEEDQRQYIEIEAREAETVEGYVAQARAEGHLIEGTVEHKILVPWKPTYWKILPYGHFVRYQETALGYGAPLRREWYQSPMRAAK